MARALILAGLLAGWAGSALAAPAPADLTVDFGAFEGAAVPAPRPPSAPAAPATAPAPMAAPPAPAAGAVTARPPPAPARPATSATFYSQSDLIAQPSVQQIIDAYPAAGRRMRVRARITLDCQVSAAGDVHGCRVVDEASRGDGFSEAALKLAPYFKMRSRGVAGTASLTVNFSPAAIREAGGRL